MGRPAEVVGRGHGFQATAEGKVIEGRNLTGGKLAWCRWGMTAGTDDDQPDGQNAREAIRRMERLGDRPWFLGVGFHKPHDPFVAPKKYFDLYPLDSLKLYRDPRETTPAPPLAVGFGAVRRTRSALSPTRNGGSSCAATTRACRSWTPRWAGCSMRSTG